MDQLGDRRARMLEFGPGDMPKLVHHHFQHNKTPKSYGDSSSFKRKLNGTFCLVE